MKTKIDRNELLRHLRACKALKCEEIRLDGTSTALRLLCGSPAISTAIPAACDSDDSCLCDAPGIEALLGTLASLDDEVVELDIQALAIEIQADRRRITVDTYSEAEDTAQIALIPRGVS